MNSPRFRLPAAGYRLTALFALLGATALFAAEKKSFNLPTGDAAATLKAFTEQSGEQVVFPVEQVKGVRTNPVVGNLTPREALDSMLADTPLRVVQDAKTGALAVTRNGKDNGGSGPNVQRAAQNARGDRPENKVKVEEGTLVLEEVEVTGSRIKQVEGEGFSPVYSFDRKAIERSGVTSLSELLNRSPLLQTSTQTGQLEGFNSNNITPGIGDNPGNATANLRGLGNQYTLILVNGRRVSGNSTIGSNFPLPVDLNSIPLGAVARVEILPDSASAVYGSEALGGVINIILRDDFSGGELTVTYANTTDSDSAETGFTFNYGTRNDRTSLFVNVDYLKKNALHNVDRRYTSSDDKRAFGGTDRLDGQFALITSGVLAITNPGFLQASVGVPLPGTGALFAAIPAGQDGRNLTPTDVIPNQLPSDARVRRYNVLSPEGERSGAVLRAQHKLWRDLAIFGELNYSRNVAEINYGPPGGLLTVPATNAFNRFGRSVQVAYRFEEMPDSIMFSRSDTWRMIGGVKGKFLKTWEWEAAYNYSSTDQKITLSNLLTTGIEPYRTAFNAAIGSSSPGNALNPFGDTAAFPNTNSPALLSTFIADQRRTGRTLSRQYDFRATGEVVHFSAGSIVAVLGGEYQSLDFSTRQVTGPGVRVTDNVAPRRLDRSVFAEMQVPIFGPDNRRALFESLALSLAGRYDEFPYFERSSFVPRVALRWQPVKSLALRGSYSEGFLPPTPQQVAAPATSTTTSVFDSRRSETYLVPTVISGGNPGLKPETSDAIAAGVVFAPTGLKGLQLSATWSHIEIVDRIAVIGTTLESAFPERFQRGPQTPADVAANRPGRWTLVDQTLGNIALIETENIDYVLTYDWIRSRGRYRFQANVSQNLAFLRQGSPISALENLRGRFGNVVARGGAGIEWEQGRWFASLAARYIDSYRISNPTGGSTQVPVDNSIEVDAHLTVQLPKMTQLSLTVVNALDSEPPFLDRVGFSRYNNPRQRFYTLALKKSL
jgi:iron complex outermembrane receptor protein